MFDHETVIDSGAVGIYDYIGVYVYGIYASAFDAKVVRIKEDGFILCRDNGLDGGILEVGPSKLMNRRSHLSGVW